MDMKLHFTENYAIWSLTYALISDNLIIIEEVSVHVNTVYLWHVD